MNIVTVLFSSILVLLSATVVASSGQNNLTIMAYNVENAFDVNHDEGKDDYTFLPKRFPGKEKHCYAQPIPYYREMCLNTDWTEDKAAVKIHQLKKMISANGLPDLVGLEEIENATVVKNLADDLGYENFIVTDSPDARGIDVALMYNQDKLSYLDHEEIVLKPKEGQLKTRNILRVNFRVKNRDAILGVYVNHWPSQQKPKEYRILAANALIKNLKAQQKEHGKDYYAVAIGDFNTTDRESPNAISDVLAKVMVDIQTYAEGLIKGKKEEELDGTYFYRANFRWERLDRIMISKNLVSKGDLQVDAESFTILKPSFGMRDYTEQKPKSPHYGKTMRNVPIPYDFGSTDPRTAGFSDHFPVLVDLHL